MHMHVHAHASERREWFAYACYASMPPTPTLLLHHTTLVECRVTLALEGSLSSYKQCPPFVAIVAKIVLYRYRKMIHVHVGLFWWFFAKQKNKPTQ